MNIWLCKRLALVGILLLVPAAVLIAVSSWSDKTLEAFNDLRSENVAFVRGRVLVDDSFEPISGEIQDLTKYKDLLLAYVSPAVLFGGLDGSRFPHIAELEFEKVDGTKVPIQVPPFGKGRMIFSSGSARCYMRKAPPVPIGKDAGRDMYMDEGLAICAFVAAVASGDKKEIEECEAVLRKSVYPRK